MTDEPFAPLGEPNKMRPRVVINNANLTCVSPVPDDAPLIPKRHPKLGEPTARFPYFSAEGKLLGEIWRFDRGAEKEFRPVSLWRNAKGQLEWRFQIWPDCRPLYGLDKLAAKPNAPVVVTEGEKAADAAARLLPGFAVVTTPGGSNAAAKADLSPLRGRKVTIWPDADKPGEKFAAAVAELALAAGAVSVAIATPPDGVAEGWDAADAEAQGWTAERAEAFIRAARSQGGAAQPTKGKRARAKDSDAPKRGVRAYIDLFDRCATLFHDGAGKSYAAVVVGDHVENLALTSKAFARWLSMEAFDEGLTPPNSATLGDTQRLLEARALRDGPEKQPFRRVGGSAGKIYINMADLLWRVINVTSRGWEILTGHVHPNIRSASMLGMVEPQGTDEGIEILRRFINTDDAGFKLVVAWLLSALYPFASFPILVLTGEHGSAKSTLTKLLRALIDPNVAPVRGPPKEENDLIVAANHSHVVALENVSAISNELNDALCRLSTGGGTGGRAKFTDGDEYFAAAKAPIVMNGISGLNGKPDFASRALFVTLLSIAEEDRLTESEFWESWAAVAPRVLAVLLDALSAALKNLPTTRPPKISRMADFEILIEAASPFLGWSPGEFAEIYRNNQSESDAATIESEPLAGAIVDMIREDHANGWEGTMSRLLELLGAKVSEAVRRSRMWPTGAGSLGMRIERLKPVLRRHGISIDRRRSGDRHVYISTTGKERPIAEESSRDDD